MVQAWLDLSPDEQISTSEVPGFPDRLLKLLPGLSDHTCSRGYPGGFRERLFEGTYLGHVIEHVVLELQKEAGFDVRYGKTVKGTEPGTWVLIFEYGTPELGIEALGAAIKLVSAVLAGKPFPVAEAIARLRQVGEETRPGPSTESILRACKKRGIPVLSLLEGRLYQLGYGCCQKLIQATITSQTSSLAVDLSCNKDLTKRLLAEAGLPVPEGRIVESWLDALRAASELGYPLAVKPCSGNQGKGVVLNVRDERELKTAFQIASAYDSQVVIEKHIEGRQYRLLVINGKMVAASERVPAHVTGDGVHTIKELVEIANQDQRRGDGHSKPLTRLRLDPASILVLARYGFTPESCPAPGETVLLRENANISTGGTAVDVTSLVAPQNAALAVRAARILGLDVAGIDLVAPDIEKPVAETGGAIIEVNAAPGFRMHLHPAGGEPRDVGDALVDYLFPPGCRTSIPVISVTGTNGKTTTARILSHIFQQQGLVVGATTTGGIYIDNNCIFAGDATGPASARTVLRNPEVEVAVLETARGGILRGGLGYDLADVAVVTNMGPDHLGQDGIETLEDLFWIKSLVVEAVKKDGYVVLNADDPFAPQFAKRARGEVVYFSLHENNLLVRRHLGTGGCAVFVRDGIAYFCRGDQAVRLLSLKAIRSGYGGRAVHNLENSLAAAAAACVSGVSLPLIRRGLRTFGTQMEHNPGRLTLRRIGKITVVVDYGHNAPAFLKICEFARSLRPRRLIGVVGVPGDRGDEQIVAAGRVAGEGFDEVIIKEDRDLRGRAPGEVAQLLYAGVRQGGLKPACIHIVLEELNALREAVERARPGDIVVIFYEELEPVLALLEQMEKSRDESSQEQRAALQN